MRTVKRTFEALYWIHREPLEELCFRREADFPVQLLPETLGQGPDVSVGATCADGLHLWSPVSKF